jgi:DNA (cytosine-5)-methyltransferase 1
MVYNIPEMVSVRKHQVRIVKLQQLLKSHKNKSIKEISEKLNIPKTQVEHWFRTDKCFSIPDPILWFKLKEVLSIKTKEFDLEMTEFEIKESIFEKSNRVYDSNGIAPTMTCTSADERILNDYKIRRLTPRECFRLMDFPDTFTWPVSDSQAYKQAGNSIVVNVLYKILKQLPL